MGHIGFNIWFWGDIYDGISIEYSIELDTVAIGVNYHKIDSA